MTILGKKARKWIALILLGVVTLSVRNSLALPLEELTWHEVSSKNVVVYSSVDLKKTGELLKHLELLNALVPELTTIDTSNSPVPTRIIFVEKKSALRQLGVKPQYGGQFSPGFRDNLIVVRDSKFDYLYEGTYYLYIKYLLNSTSSTPIPTWITEGFAQYLRTISIEGDGSHVKIGRLSRITSRGSTACGWKSAIDLLNDVALSRCELGIRASRLVRQLIQDPDMRTHLNDYLSRLSQGEDRLDAFASGFKLDLAEFDSEVVEYSKKTLLPTHEIDIEALIPNFELGLRRMEREEVALVLGRAALRTRQLKKARHWLTIATTASSQRASALSALGVVSLFEGRFDDAEAFSNEAIELDPECTEFLLDAAKLWIRRAYEEVDVHKRDEHLTQARLYIGKAWKLNDIEPETYAMYGRSFLLQQNFAKAVDTLEAANRLLPSHTGTILDLAQTYQRLNRPADAENLFDLVVRRGHLISSELVYVYPAKSGSSDPNWMLRKQDEIAPSKHIQKILESADFWY